MLMTLRDLIDQYVADDVLWLPNYDYTDEWFAPDAVPADYPLDLDDVTWPLHKLREQGGSAGACDETAAHFTWFAQQHGFDARVVTGTPDQLGYTDRLHDSCYGGHAVAVVTTSEGSYSVDFAAEQYGYTEFPLLREAVLSVSAAC